MMRFAFKCSRVLVGDETYQEPSDVLADFVIRLLELIRAGKYEHQGALDRWIGKVWKRFLAGFKKKHFEEVNCTIGLNNRDEFDDDGEEIGESEGRINPAMVDWEQAQRDTESWNSPSRRVSRVMRDLDNPNTAFGQLDEVTKAMIRALAKGMTQAQAAESVGLSERQARRKLEQVAKFREHSFVSASDVGSVRVLSSIHGEADPEECSNVVCITDGEFVGDICGAAEDVQMVLPAKEGLSVAV